ncbi:hypothetical protein COT40_01565 [Candidatus Peregrinibacteria bacterium CG08_land_8_20_14_0_20_41_10]|nr:MAG: hypothetical protein COT40_01565 [Candidatus Peregrinibacteria bacterium CG08_land_8_20_14_0_20_41_10]
MELYKIPQDVERADKLVGPLTLKQLITCVVGGTLAYSIYVSFAPTTPAIFWVPSVLIILLLTLAIAFLKINHLTFPRVILLLIESAINPRKRYWVQMAGNLNIFQTVNLTASLEEKERVKKEKKDVLKIADIGQISQILDTAGNSPQLNESVQKPVVTDELADEMADITGQAKSEIVNKFKTMQSTST